jgi:NADH-quinone oxidoreductase subunit E
MVSPEADKKIDELIARYPVKRSAILPVLFVVQGELGYLPDEAMYYAAKKLDLTYMDVASTASFYTMFYRQPMGRYNIQLCRNISCYLCGCEEIKGYLEKKLGIRFGETTSDGRFTLMEVECIGACSWAPAMQINFDFHQDLTPEKIDQVLDELP